MTCKVIEIRDRGTHIEAMAIRMKADNPNQVYGIHERSGHPVDGSSIVLMHLDSLKATNDPYEWPSLGMGPRTMVEAHNFIIDYFDEIADGEVVDVEYLLGETKAPKVSENLP